jgi:hypothetical protein
MRIFFGVLALCMCMSMPAFADKAVDDKFKADVIALNDLRAKLIAQAEEDRGAACNALVPIARKKVCETWYNDIIARRRAEIVGHQLQIDALDADLALRKFILEELVPTQKLEIDNVETNRLATQLRIIFPPIKKSGEK